MAFSHIADPNHIAFDPTSNCPLYLASDGGLDIAFNTFYFNLCLTTWRPTGADGFNAVQIYDLNGQIGPLYNVDLYFGTQDNQFWASPDRGATWPYSYGNEGGRIQLPRYQTGDPVRRVTLNDFGSGAYIVTQPYYASPANWNNPPPGNPADAPTLISPGVYVQWSQPA